MDHRIKNLFAVTGSIVSLSVSAATTPKDMALTIQGRLTAMARAHNLVRPGRLGSGIDTAETTLSEIVETILRPLAGAIEPGQPDRATADGPDVAVSGDAVTSLSMVLHELATNAAKYGALSQAEGRVAVTWMIKKGRLELIWVERGGPHIDEPPKHEGFGSMLAQNSIKGQLDGQIDYDWSPDGLIIKLSVLVERLAPPRVSL